MAIAGIGPLIFISDIDFAPKGPVSSYDDGAFALALCQGRIDR
ncbi:unnamed protein product, partial [marine sediment metagenome]